MNVARFSHTCNLIQRTEDSKEIVVVGGYDNHYNGLDSVEIYSITNKVWRHGKWKQYIMLTLFIRPPINGIFCIQLKAFRGKLLNIHPLNMAMLSLSQGVTLPQT